MATPQHILFVAPFGLGPKGTVRARTLPLARAMVRSGCTVTVLIPPWDTPGDSGRCWRDDGVQVLNVSARGGAVVMLPRLLRVIVRSAPDVVHIVKPRAHAGLVQWCLWHARQVLPFRLVLDVDDWEQAWSAVAGYAWPLARFLDWQERWGITHAEGVTCASRWLQRAVAERAPTMPTLYLPNGVEAVAESGANSRTPAEDRPPTVLLFSRFVEVSPGWLTRFWQALRNEVADVRLRVAGRGLQPQHERAVRLGLEGEGQVEWLGFVEPDQLATLYAEADCAIFPAADSPLNQAKCSVRLATTLLHGLPVVASAVGEQARYGAQGAARLVPAEASPEAFAAAVADQLRTPESGRQMAAQARERLLTDYSWDLLGEQLLAFYQTLNQARLQSSC